MLKFVNPLKWALAESLVKLSGLSATPNGADQYEKTRITLLHVCGIDPTRVPLEYTERLNNQILELQEMKKVYEALIKSMEKKLHDAESAETPTE